MLPKTFRARMLVVILLIGYFVITFSVAANAQTTVKVEPTKTTIETSDLSMSIMGQLVTQTIKARENSSLMVTKEFKVLYLEITYEEGVYKLVSVSESKVNDPVLCTSTRVSDIRTAAKTQVQDFLL